MSRKAQLSVVFKAFWSRTQQQAKLLSTPAGLSNAQLMEWRILERTTHYRIVWLYHNSSWHTIIVYFYKPVLQRAVKPIFTDTTHWAHLWFYYDNHYMIDKQYHEIGLEASPKLSSMRSAKDLCCQYFLLVVFYHLWGDIFDEDTASYLWYEQRQHPFIAHIYWSVRLNYGTHDGIFTVLVTQPLSISTIVAGVMRQ